MARADQLIAAASEVGIVPGSAAGDETTRQSFRPATRAYDRIQTKSAANTCDRARRQEQGPSVQVSIMGTGRYARLDVGGLIKAIHLVEQLHKDALHLPAPPVAASAAEQLHIAAAMLQ